MARGWTENQTLHSSSSVTAGGTATDDIDLAANNYEALLIQVRVTFGSTPDGDCRVDIFGSPDSGTTDDNIPLIRQVVQRATSVTIILSLVVRMVPYIAVRLTNDDSTDSVTYVAIYAGFTAS